MESFQGISKYAICYCIFFLLTYLSKLDNAHKLILRNNITAKPGLLCGLQVAGILWLGIVPAHILPASFLSIVSGNQLFNIPQILTLLIVLIIAVQVAGKEAQKKGEVMLIAQNDIPFLHKKFLYKYFILRIFFLGSYEIFFRGYLLTSCIPYFGIPGAIAINIGLDGLLHLFCDKKEIIGCIPFGAILCCFCVWFGCAWPAIAIHIIFSLSYESIALRKSLIPVNKII